MVRKRPRKDEHVAPPVGDRVEAEIVGKRDTITGVVKVRATFATKGYVRVAEALLEDEHAARFFIQDMNSRLRQGLDPVAGMDPVECYPVGEKSRSSAAPRFVRATG